MLYLEAWNIDLRCSWNIDSDRQWRSLLGGHERRFRAISFQFVIIMFSEGHQLFHKKVERREFTNLVDNRKSTIRCAPFADSNVQL
jgi:hypothetical protein